VDDVAAILVNDHQHQLAERFLLPAQPAGLSRVLANKASMGECATRAGVPTPRTVQVSCAEDTRSALADLKLPVVVKAGTADVLAKAPQAASVFIAHTVEEATAAVAVLEDAEPGAALLQEFIPGGPQSICMVNGYFDAGSKPLFLATGRKLRQRPPDTGPTSLGVCKDVPEVRELTARLMSAVGYAGPLDAGFRYDERDGSYKVIDVNPRVGATFRLFVGSDGTDVVRAMYLDLTGQRVAPSAVPDGRRWLVEHSDIAAAPEYIRRRGETVGSYLRSQSVDERAWWARDDVKPFAAMLATASSRTRWVPHRRSAAP
jgi:predicted ATP-grasp superfamily ATP-dependent carboligase